MAFCSYCGKEFDLNSKFCSYCGKRQRQDATIASKKEKTKEMTNVYKEHSHSRSVVISIILGLFFILFVTILLIFANKEKGDNLSKAEDLITLAEEKVVDIKDSPSDINFNVQKRKEGFSLNEKPFDEENYAYDERTKDFRLVCINPCPVSKGILDQELAAINYAVSTLRGLTKSDINEELMPFEVHASEDSICQILPKALAYKTIFIDSNGYSRGLLCFFFDKLPYNRDKFPYSTSVHEVTHLFEHGKYKDNDIIDEGLSEMLESFFLKGNDKNSFCWQGNAWYKQVLKNSDDPHWVGGDLFFELCNRYGFDYNDLPELFRQLDNKGGNVNELEFVKIINGIVGSDTTSLFKEAGVI